MSREAAGRREKLGAVFNCVMLSLSLVTAIQQYARSAMSNGLPTAPLPGTPPPPQAAWSGGDRRAMRQRRRLTVQRAPRSEAKTADAETKKAKKSNSVNEIL